MRLAAAQAGGKARHGLPPQEGGLSKTLRSLFQKAKKTAFCCWRAGSAALRPAALRLVRCCRARTSEPFCVRRDSKGALPPRNDVIEFEKRARPKVPSECARRRVGLCCDASWVPTVHRLRRRHFFALLGFFPRDCSSRRLISEKLTLFSHLTRRSEARTRGERLPVLVFRVRNAHSASSEPDYVPSRRS